MTWKFVTCSHKKTPKVVAVLRAIPNPSQAAQARRQPLIRQIRIYNDAGNVIETHEHKGDFNEW